MENATFRAFFAKMQPRLVRYACRELDLETAREVTNDTFYSLWSKDLKEPETEIDQQRLESLAYSILRGHIKNTLRATRSRVSAEERFLEQVKLAARGYDPSPSTTMRDDLLDRIRLLRDTHREVLSLYLDSYRVAEIATILGIQPKTASMRLARATDALRAVLKEVNSSEQS